LTGNPRPVFPSSLPAKSLLLNWFTCSLFQFG
jgi:hypothetical protein